MSTGVHMDVQRVYIGTAHTLPLDVDDHGSVSTLQVIVSPSPGSMSPEVLPVSITMPPLNPHDDTAKAVEKDMSHWEDPKLHPAHPLSLLWAGLCLASVFRPSLQSFRTSCEDEILWKELVDRMVSRVSNSNTAVCFGDMFGGLRANRHLPQAGLILATSAVLMTTIPPSMDTWNYIQIPPYFLLGMALFYSLLSIWYGTSLIIIYQAATRKWVVCVRGLST